MMRDRVIYRWEERTMDVVQSMVVVLWESEKVLNVWLGCKLSSCLGARKEGAKGMEERIKKLRYFEVLA